eukprot:1804797-Alexandrium_andersonii.AAC.1
MPWCFRCVDTATARRQGVRAWTPSRSGGRPFAACLAGVLQPIPNAGQGRFALWACWGQQPLPCGRSARLSFGQRVVQSRSCLNHRSGVANVRIAECTWGPCDFSTSDPLVILHRA